ncbi:colicin E3/pyocin S6 family cytotoxin [Rhizobium leguminosarum]|uniref:colicin E3/pyocin S6 family cytotoxin n=1 Tax=Rhizobium leguminosarum TaxID=384 RepID=UPI0021BBD8CA|nr:colicin E3/pyocin S6 family cytotoxin [Rhizobium leguminosarum]
MYFTERGRLGQSDYQHGKIEKFDKSGKKHLGEYYPVTGAQTNLQSLDEQHQKDNLMQVSLVLELYEKQGQVLKNTLDVEFSDLEFFRQYYLFQIRIH